MSIFVSRTGRKQALPSTKRKIMDNIILIIDSNTQELRKLREILTREGYNIMTATDRETAIQICQRIPVKFVLAETAAVEFPKAQQGVGTDKV